MANSRRDFLRNLTAAGIGASALGGIVEQASASGGVHIFEDWMGVLVDIPKCIGCRRCEFACKEAATQAAEAHGSPKEAERFRPEPMETFEDKSIFSNGHLRRPEPHCYTVINEFPNPEDSAKPLYAKVNCLHCNKPACVSACIVGAFRKLDNGPVIYDAWKCMGCRYCMVACPFAIPTYEYDNLFTPQVRKCTLCADEYNPNNGKIPACIGICPQEVMTYGKRPDLLELAHEKITRSPDVYLDHVYGEHEVGGTSWLYLAPKVKPFTELGFLDLDFSVPPLRTESIQHGVFKYFVPPVAWYGLLGAMMWLTRPDENKADPATTEGHH
ncbi:MAG: 4Fe-4S dicluster domain-containing protein [Planctomycetes bacterium]|nr:4Fe-4S dicluster domain-containing protein [Planctomycetota bacterium]